ncbi:MAG: sulfatase-like hydrolase/transferase, partial [Deltaproteobacteria bacterium]|nr:sulfatase-like hydrolase/transferase [Deltaproteobacteria bacterium]
MAILAITITTSDANAEKNTGPSADNRPNVVYIVLDDVGYADLGCYGSEIETANMDRLAADGLSYNNFHVTPTCSPTRAALLTGRNSHSVGMGVIAEVDLGPEQPAYRGRVTHAAATAAQLLRSEGYSTFAVGKWHLVPNYQATAAGPFEYWPLGKGFNRFYGFMHGSTDQFAPELVEDNKVIEAPKKNGYNLTHDLIDNAIGMLRNHVSIMPERPFFLYLGTPGMHAPHQAPAEYLDRYKGVYDKGWDKIREDRFKRQRKMGLIPASADLAPPNPGVKPWDHLSDNEKRVFARFQEIYAGFLEQTDTEIGRLLTELKHLGKLENTLIVLLSDNGGSQEGGPNGSVNHSAYYNGITESP